MFPEYDTDFWEGILLFDDMNEAFVGIAQQFTNETVAVYDYDLCLKCLMKSGMSEEDALEWFVTNTQGSWIGERTPMILYQRGDKKKK
jgi:hypothetical protein